MLEKYLKPIFSNKVKSLLDISSGFGKWFDFLLENLDLEINCIDAC